MLAALERGVQVVEHVVEGDHAPLALAPAQVGADGVDQVADQAQAGEFELAGDRAAGGEQGVGGVEERVGRASSGPCWCAVSARELDSSSSFAVGVERARAARLAGNRRPRPRRLDRSTSSLYEPLWSAGMRRLDELDDRRRAARPRASPPPRTPRSAPPCRSPRRRIERRRATGSSPAAWRGCAAGASRTSPGCPSSPAGRRRAPAAQLSSATRRRQKSWTASSAISLSSVTSSSEKGRPAVNDASASARWQKPWMVKIAASSKYCSALSSVSASCRRVEAGALLRPPCTSSATNGSPEGAAASPSRSQASVSTIRERMRSRSSAVAALVNVTTRICCTSSSRSSSSRRYRPQMFQVLPVPAEASIRLMPSRLQSKTSNSVGAVSCRQPRAGRLR